MTCYSFDFVELSNILDNDINLTMFAQINLYLLLGPI